MSSRFALLFCILSVLTTAGIAVYLIYIFGLSSSTASRDTLVEWWNANWNIAWSCVIKLYVRQYRCTLRDVIYSLLCLLWRAINTNGWRWQLKEGTCWTEFSLSTCIGQYFYSHTVKPTCSRNNVLQKNTIWTLNIELSCRTGRKWLLSLLQYNISVDSFITFPIRHKKK